MRIILLITLIVILFLMLFDTFRKVWLCPKCKQYHEAALGKVGIPSFDADHFAGEKVCDECKKYKIKG